MSSNIAPAVLQKEPTTVITELPAATEPLPAPEPAEPADEIEEEWETESDYDSNADFSREVEEENGHWPFQTEPNPDVCTAEEAKEFKDRLRKVGPNQFIQETLSAGLVSVQKLCTAFGFDLPIYERNEESYLRLLGRLIQRELERRHALPQYKTIDDAAQLLREKSNIIVLTGAGISTSLGIPDFRSPNTGFYEMLRERGFSDPEEVFDLTRFDEDPLNFFHLAGEILPTQGVTSPTHAFIALLQAKKKLLTNFTQNIDNVEEHAGINKSRLVQCHGSWATATCRKCKHQVPGVEIFEDVRSKRVARCKKCTESLAAASTGMKRKRSANGSNKPRKRHADSDSEDDGRYDIEEAGVMKPDITFFGESLPDKFFNRISQDRPDLDSLTGKIRKMTLEERMRKRPDLTSSPYGPADLVIVIGTSMKVAPVSEIPHYIPHEVPHIYISRDPIKHIEFDINLIGDCDPIVAELCRRAGFDLQHPMLASNLAVEVQAYEKLDENGELIQRLDNTFQVQAQDSKNDVKTNIKSDS